MRNVIEQIINYAILAPSSHNTQPWKFIVEKDRIDLRPDYDRQLVVVDPDHHELFISLGCALENLVIAAKKWGYNPVISFENDGDIFIRIKLEPALFKEDSLLFDQMEIRQTTRNRYNGTSIPSRHLMMLNAIEMEPGIQCRIITNRNEFDSYINLVKEACIWQFSQEEYVAELVKWIRFNRVRAAKSNDGLYSAAAGKPDLPEWFGRFIVGITIDPEREAKKCEMLIRSSSALVVFVAENDDKKNWIRLGRSFERFALTASCLNINLAHQNAPCEVKSVQSKLAMTMKLKKGQQPLMLSRIGYSAKMPYSFRRPVSEVIFAEEVIRDEMMIY